MTARAFSDALGPLALQLARAAGWKDSTWRKAVHDGRDLTPEERAALRDALRAHICTARIVARSLAP